MDVTGCPSEPELLAFHLGTAPVETLDQVADHLERCPRCEAALGVGAALGLGLLLAPAEIIEDLVPRDAAQPPAERLSSVLSAKPFQAHRHGLKNILADVLGVRGVYAPVPAPVHDQRGVQVQQALPGVLVAGPHPLEQGY